MKKFKNRAIIIGGIILLVALAATAIFAAGQYFQLLPNPKYIGIGCVIGIALLVIGIIIGMHTEKNPKE